MGALEWQLAVMAGVAVLTWLAMRSRRADRVAIENFVGQHGLHVISTKRFHNHFRYWLRGVAIYNNARLYSVAVEDSERNQSVLRAAFNSLFGSEKMDVLEHLKSGPTSQRGSIQPVLGQEAVQWTWYERLTLFCAGLSMGGFFFCAILNASLAPPNRPAVPNPAAGYIYLFSGDKYHDVYGTFFEYWVQTYGLRFAIGVSVVTGLFAYILEIHRISPTYLRQVFAVAAISCVLFYATWRVFFS